MDKTIFFVGVSSWIIQDGNYGDFRIGQRTSFAVEFFPNELTLSAHRTHAAQRIDGCRYRVSGHVIYADRSSWVVDVGIMAYQNHAPPRDIAQGELFEGEFHFGIDPFFYFEELYARPGMPALRYDWLIRNIFLETTPWKVTTDSCGGTVYSRDSELKSFVEVPETNAWKDDEGRAHYVLEAEVIGR